MAMTHDEATKAKALELCEQVGAAEASRQLGIAEGTVASWWSRSGRASMRTEQTRAAVEARKLSRADRVARLAEKLLTEAETELQRLREPYTDTRVSASGKAVSWEQPEPAPSDRRNIATTTAILIDKSQLLAGEATSRTESLTPAAAREEVTKLRDELAERRRRRDQVA